MAFALQLRESLDERHGRLEQEFAAGADLRTILTRHLEAVEKAADTELLTSILLLEGGLRLRHAAAPRLPDSYCEAIDGGEIGPAAGSCGTAAFVGHPIYVVDIATDPLWADYREIALEHGLRACWSTPIFGPQHAVLGTFAIYHPTPRSPTPAEVQAIAMISERVSAAIVMSRTCARERQADLHYLRLQEFDGLRAVRDRLNQNASSLRGLTKISDAQDITDRLHAVARDCRSILYDLKSWNNPLN